MEEERTEERRRELEVEAVDTPQRGFGTQRRTGGVVPVETGRGSAVDVPVGSPFVSTLERIADEANYGGYYRVFLNGEEIVEPGEAPETIEEDMRLQITSYDKVG